MTRNFLFFIAAILVPVSLGVLRYVINEQQMEENSAAEEFLFGIPAQSRKPALIFNIRQSLSLVVSREKITEREKLIEREKDSIRTTLMSFL